MKCLLGPVCASERINNIPALLDRRERNLLENMGRRGLRRHERQHQVASAPPIPDPMMTPARF
jgi:hypothetical protein